MKRSLQPLIGGHALRQATWSGRASGAWQRDPPIPASEIASPNANMYLIPADAGVARELLRVDSSERLRDFAVEVAQRPRDSQIETPPPPARCSPILSRVRVARP